MARYYFSLKDGHPIGDPLGEELPDEKTALAAAREIAVDLARNNGNLATSASWSETERKGVGEVALMADQFAK